MPTECNRRTHSTGATARPATPTRVGYLIAFVLMASAGVRALSGEADASLRADLCLRESLVAIRDWEAILSRQDEASAIADAAFPVPADGGAVSWPNPVPLRLLPGNDPATRTDVRRISPERFEIRMQRGGEPPARVETGLGETATVYRHPGGGGADRWNHRFTRQFDLLCTVRPKPAPFAIETDAPLDLGYGANTVELRIRNVDTGPLEVRAGIRRISARGAQGGDGNPDTREQVLSLQPGATGRVAFSIQLREPGGGLLIVTLEARTPEGTEQYRIPFLTHVEDTSAVLTGIRGILEDTPDPRGATRLAELQRDMDALQNGGPPPAVASGAAWRRLYADASHLRETLLLNRLHFDSLVFVKRHPFTSEQPFMDSHHCYNPPGGGIYRLSPPRPDGRVEPVIDQPANGIYRDLCLHWRDPKLLFAFGNGRDRGEAAPGSPASYSIYEIGVDGTGLRRLTDSPKNDCEPFYLPDGRIGFTSDRSEHFVMCGSNIHVANLFTMAGDGSDIRQLSYNVFNDFNPCLLPDGRILYSRWEYNERSVTALHGPFTMRPDGRMVDPYYGNASIRPNVVMFPRPVPGSTKIMGLFTAHHGQTHGPIGLIDRRRGVDGPEALTILTPGVPMTGERIEDSRHGWYSDPFPLSEDTYLCSFTPTAVPWLPDTWALYVGDRHGNLALIYRDPTLSCAEPRPVLTVPEPHRHDAVDPGTGGEANDAELILLSAQTGLRGPVPPGTAKYLRIIEDVPRQGVPEGGVIVTSGTSIYTVKRVLGTVPVEQDGSAYFTVPADRNVYFELLDADRLEIQRMRSVVCLKPGEKRSCIGCHESRLLAPTSARAAAAMRKPDVPELPPWGTAVLSYLRDVQPVLDAKCVRCHTHDRMGNEVILTGDLTRQFAVSYQELLPYVRVANAMRWDHPDDVLPQPPYTYGSKVSPLTTLLREGHYEVELTDDEWQRLATWIDANAPYYDRYEARDPQRNLFPGTVEKALADVHTRRCAPCHGKGDGHFDTWWQSLNRQDVARSRALIAPLAQSAGGWQRCGKPVFEDTNDPDYRILLAALSGLRQDLGENPREDLLSLRGTPVETQRVDLPPPPAPSVEQPENGDGWTVLSALPWEAAAAGWTPNDDGLPRVDSDVSGGPLRAGPRVYPRGLGTHAPSEIRYRLDGAYQRLAGMVFAAEERGSVVFRVYGDGELLYDSGVLHGLGSPRRMEVGLAGVRELRLVVTDAGDGYACDMANWANPRLLPATPAE